MRGRAHAKKPRTQAHAHSQQPRTQTNKINARARAFKKNELKQTRSMRGRAHSKTRELKQTKSMRGRAHSKKTRTQANTIDARPRAFKKVANSIKQCQCEGARSQRNRELKHTRLMRGRALQRNRKLKQTRSMRERAL